MSRWISMFRPSEKIFHSRMCAERCGFECTLFSEKRKKRTRRNVIDDVIIINESLIMIHLLVSISCSEVIFCWNRPKLRTKWLMNWRFSFFSVRFKYRTPFQSKYVWLHLCICLLVAFARNMSILFGYSIVVAFLRKSLFLKHSSIIQQFQKNAQ